MTDETLHEALASIGLNSRPHSLPGKREVFRANSGEIIGPMNVTEAWKYVWRVRGWIAA